ncbi:hypothetical protein L596_030246 [Steinernema carpocapsae]|uniref:Uncharacterized protein n=1 Tax=Steinernema carpocapsae TaxID=34508 RepID=A0A4U5LS52_STECR|nr:hypothetical protein L596_030246 [Steinernema carpocapsae]
MQTLLLSAVISLLFTASSPTSLLHDSDADRTASAHRQKRNDIVILEHEKTYNMKRLEQLFKKGAYDILMAKEKLKKAGDNATLVKRAKKEVENAEVMLAIWNTEYNYAKEDARDWTVYGSHLKEAEDKEEEQKADEEEAKEPDVMITEKPEAEDELWADVGKDLGTDDEESDMKNATEAPKRKKYRAEKSAASRAAMHVSGFIMVVCITLL